VFAYINHAHLLGRKLWTSLERDGKFLHDVGCDAAYSFDLQQILPFEKHVKLYSDDTLYANCVYDSTERTEITQGGDETTNEMCINFLVYYPFVKDGNLKCLTKPRVVTPTSVGLNKMCCAGDTAVVKDGQSCTGTVSGAPGESKYLMLPTWLIIHIVCMVLGWLILLPMGITIAAVGRNLNIVDKCGGWFKCHWILNSSGLFIAFVGALAAMTSLPTHFDSVHKIIGLIVMILAILQPLNAFVRPSHGEKTQKRALWEMLHKNVGRLLGIGAFINIILGTVVVRSKYQGNVTAVYACIGIFVVIMLCLVVTRVVMGPFGGEATKVSKVTDDVDAPVRAVGMADMT